MRLNERVQGAIAHTSLVRFVALAIWCVIIAATPYESYGLFPREMLSAFGAGHVLLWFPLLTAIVLATPTLVAVKWLGVFTCAAAALKPRWRVVTAVALGAVLLLDLLTKSIGGYVNHAQFAPIMVVAVFVALRPRDCVSLPELLRWHKPRPVGQPGSGPHASESREDASGESCEAALWLAALTVVLPYTYVAVNRLLTGGLAVFFSDAIIDYSRVACSNSPTLLCQTALEGTSNPIVAALLRTGFLATTLFEACSPLVLVATRFRTVWLCAMIAFHVGTLVFMNIFFWENVILLIALFGPWGGWGTVRRRQAPSQLVRPTV